MRRFLIFLGAVFIIGCSNSPQPTKINLLNVLDENTSVKDSNELYFHDTKGKKFYSHTKPSLKQGWVSVTLYTKKGKKRFEIMKSPVSLKDFKISNSNSPVTNISFKTMAKYCMSKHATLATIFVFEKARKKHLLSKPPVKYEILAPVDEEDDDIYINQKDKVINKDNTVIRFDWQKEIYEEVPIIFKSKNTTFRCMREK